MFSPAQMIGAAGSSKSQCKSMVRQHGSRIVKMLKEHSSEEVCASFGVCKQSAQEGDEAFPGARKLLIDDYQSGHGLGAPSSSHSSLFPSLGGPLCSICSTFVDYAKVRLFECVPCSSHVRCGRYWPAATHQRKERHNG